MRISSAILCAGLLLAGQSFADDIEKAKAEMKAGGKDFVEGKCKSALIHFNAASNYAPEAAGPHRELGKTYECLEKYDETKREYELYLQMKPDAPDADEIKGYIVGVEKKITEIDPGAAENKPTFTDGKLTFEVDKGAKISVDGKSLGKDQIKSGYSLPPGKYTVRIEKKGFETLTKDVEVEEGKTVAINEALVPTTNGEEAPTDGPKRSKVPAFASFGVAAGGVGLGVFAGLQALKLNDELAALEDQPIPQDEFDEFVQQGETFNLLTIVGYSVAGAAAGAGVFLLIRSGKPVAADEASAQKLQVMPTIGGLSAKLSF